MAVPAPTCAESNNSRLIDSRPFNGAGVKQYPERFSDFDCMASNGFPTDDKCHAFLDGLTHVLTAETAETAYNHELIAEANRRGIESYIQPNFEFCDYLIKNDLPLPTKFLAPSSWNIDALRQRFGDRVVLLRPPTMPEDFARARQANIGRKGRRRFLHIIGKPATGDRNGTMVLMHAMQRSRGDFELVVKCQQQLQPLLRDRRISWDFSPPEEQWKLYEGFDLMIMARRYGGLCLPLAESLTSGLPALMSNVSPNNELLPADWLI